MTGVLCNLYALHGFGSRIISLPTSRYLKLEESDNLARRVHSSRAELIRGLLSEKLAEKENEEMEQAMKEGYMANYGFIKESGEEWDFTLGDGI